MYRRQWGGSSGRGALCPGRVGAGRHLAAVGAGDLGSRAWGAVRQLGGTHRGQGEHCSRS
jgi:hypothetical protein